MSSRVETGVGDRGQAGVDGERQRVDHQPPSERRASDAREHRLGARTARRSIGAPAASGSCGSPTRSGASGPPVGSNSGSHTSSCCSNRTTTSWPMCTSLGIAPDDVRGEPDAGVLLERDDGDHVGRVRRPATTVCAFTVNPTTVPRPETGGGLPRTAPARPGRSARAGGRACRSRCSPGCGGGRRRPTSRTTRWPASARVAASARLAVAVIVGPSVAMI